MSIKKIKLGLLSFILPATSFAAESGVNAWETILSKFADSLTGPVAYAISIMVIFACGMAMAFADLQGGAKNFVQAACGISVACFASQIVTGFLGFSGALI